MSEAPFAVNEWLDDLERAIDQAGPIYTRIADAAVGSLWFIPWPLRDHVVDALSWALQELSAAIVDLVQTLVELLQGAHFPVLAFQYAAQWDQARDELDALEATLDDLPLKRQPGWDGDAASIYRDAVLPDQVLAVGAVRDAAGQTGGTMRNLGLATGAFYAGIAIAVAAWITEMSVAAGAAATGVGAPPAVVGAAASTVKTVGLIGASVSAITAFANGSLSAFNELNGQLQGSPFTGQAWPEGVR